MKRFLDLDGESRFLAAAINKRTPTTTLETIWLSTRLSLLEPYARIHQAVGKVGEDLPEDEEK